MIDDRDPRNEQLLMVDLGKVIKDLMTEEAEKMGCTKTDIAIYGIYWTLNKIYLKLGKKDEKQKLALLRPRYRKAKRTLVQYLR